MDQPHTRPSSEDFPFNNCIPDYEDINSEYILRLTVLIDLVINVVKEEYIKELL